jgi:nicotinate-nucleotide adenylyltransferase
LAGATQAIGIFGGTFDPIHHAHLRVALDVLECLPLAQVRFVPSHQPPHRGVPGAGSAQRLAMLEEALAGQPGFVIDDRELRRAGPSYMIDTLASLRAQYAQIPLALLLGWDAFCDFASWWRWQEIPQYAHLIVLARPGYEQRPLPEAIAELLRARALRDPNALCARPAGAILLQPVTQLAISATLIRTLLAQGRSPRYLVPEAVYNYIQEHRLYR